MPNLIREYNGFTLNASTALAAQGFLPQVCISRDNGNNVVEQIFYPDHPANGFPTVDDALQAGMNYGLNAVDGRIKGIDLTKLL